MIGDGDKARLSRIAVDRAYLVPAPKICPIKKCQSSRIHRHHANSRLSRKVAGVWGNKAPCIIDQCEDCGNFWEAWPDDDPGDVVEREPCDTCAYRAGSPESQDPLEWRLLCELPREAAGKGGPFVVGCPWFCCHKGIPIRIEGNDIMFDFAAAGRSATEQPCVGFLRIYWKHKADLEGGKGARR